MKEVSTFIVAILLTIASAFLSARIALDIIQWFHIKELYSITYESMLGIGFIYGLYKSKRPKKKLTDKEKETQLEDGAKESITYIVGLLGFWGLIYLISLIFN